MNISNRVSVGILAVFVAAIGGYAWYTLVYSTCRIPVEYDIGFIDDRFDITADEALAAARAAEALWEDATGQNLFSYTSDAELRINFAFDERQEQAEWEAEQRAVLEEKEEMSDEIRAEYESLRDAYDALKADYDERAAAYERKLALHNEEVDDWNDEGGAPPDVYDALRTRQEALARESEDLNAMAFELTGLADSINALGEQGNSVVREYNEEVEHYNDLFGEEREITQGDFQRDRITIYQFDDTEELTLVLAHELGHALSLGHVDDRQSVMHHFLEGDMRDITSADLAEFTRVCGSH